MTDEEDSGWELGRLAPLVDIEIGRNHKRPMCLSCNRPASVCWCCVVDTPSLRGVRCRVLVLQHPHEEKRCLRTAPMLENALPHCSIRKGKRFSADAVPELVSPDSIVLFPGPDAVEVESLATVAERGRPYNLIVIDGTWHQAKAIMYKTKELRALKKVVVRSPVVSHYVIRTQPSDAAVSTVECAALALAALEDDPTIYATLVRPLTTLCQHQLSHGAVVHQSKEHRYRLADAPSMGKRTAKTLAQCGAVVSPPSNASDHEETASCTGGLQADCQNGSFLANGSEDRVNGMLDIVSSNDNFFNKVHSDDCTDNSDCSSSPNCDCIVPLSDDRFNGESEDSRVADVGLEHSQSRRDDNSNRTHGYAKGDGCAFRDHCTGCEKNIDCCAEQSAASYAETSGAGDEERWNVAGAIQTNGFEIADESGNVEALQISKVSETKHSDSLPRENWYR